MRPGISTQKFRKDCLFREVYVKNRFFEFSHGPRGSILVSRQRLYVRPSALETVAKDSLGVGSRGVGVGSLKGGLVESRPRT